MRGLILVLMPNVLLGRNFDFLGGYLVVTARYLVVITGYCSLPGGYCSLLVVTARYRLLLLVPTFSMNAVFDMIAFAKEVLIGKFIFIWTGIVKGQITEAYLEPCQLPMMEMFFKSS